MRHRGSKTQVVELVVMRAQADFNVGQTLAISDLRKGHGEKLIQQEK